MKFRKPNCPKWDTCSAPICPKIRYSMRECIWFPDEEICAQIQRPWIEQQKEIQKQLEQGEVEWRPYGLQKKNGAWVLAPV